MKITVLGSGSSSGVPAIDMGWGECDPANPKNRRRRPGILVEWPEPETRLLIDTPPDLREQLLDAGADWLSAVLYTHAHADHLHGIDDIRGVNRTMQQAIPVYLDQATHESIQSRFGYVLEAIPPRDDGTPPFYYKPVLAPQHVIEAGDSFEIGGQSVRVFDQDHGFSHTLGYRIGDFAYSTDVTRLDDSAFELLAGVRVWMIAVLGWNDHPTHAHVDKALDWIERVGPERGVLGHLSPKIDYRTLKDYLPDHVEPAFDGMVIEL